MVKWTDRDFKFLGNQTGISDINKKKRRVAWPGWKGADVASFEDS